MKQRYYLLLCLFISLIVCLSYSPFRLPVIGDNAFFTYVAQQFSEGKHIYRDTTFGYPPLSIIISGWFIKIMKIFFPSFPSYLSPVFLGIANYLAMAAAMFALCTTLFKDKFMGLTGSILFSGIGYVTIQSNILLFPKLVVALVTIWGMMFTVKEKYFWAGFFFTLGALTWQPAVISLTALFIYLFIEKKLLKSVKPLYTGILLGLLPVALYLLWSDDWIYFWKAAVIHRLKTGVMHEGGGFFLLWLIKPLYKELRTDIPLFLLSFSGFALTSYELFCKRMKAPEIISSSAAKFLLIITLGWSLFNCIDFQSARDLFSMLPVLVTWAVFFVCYIKIKYGLSRTFILFALSFLAFADIPLAGYLKTKPAFSLSDEKTLYDNIDNNFNINKTDKIITLGLEESVFVILEKPSYFRQTRLNEYNLGDKGCKDIIDNIKKEKAEVLIRYNTFLRPCEQALFDGLNLTGKMIFKTPAGNYTVYKIIN